MTTDGMQAVQTIGDVFRKVKPSVVVIRAKGEVSDHLRPGQVIELKGWHP